MALYLQCLLPRSGRTLLPLSFLSSVQSVGNLKSLLVNCWNCEVDDIMMISRGNEIQNEDSLLTLHDDDDNNNNNCSYRESGRSAPRDSTTGGEKCRGTIFVFWRSSSSAHVQVTINVNSKKHNCLINMNSLIFSIKEKLYTTCMSGGILPESQHLILNGKKIKEDANILFGDYLLAIVTTKIVENFTENTSIKTNNNQRPLLLFVFRNSAPAATSSSSSSSDAVFESGAHRLNSPAPAAAALSPPASSAKRSGSSKKTPLPGGGGGGKSTVTPSPASPRSKWVKCWIAVNWGVLYSPLNKRSPMLSKRGATKVNQRNLRFKGLKKNYFVEEKAIKSSKRNLDKLFLFEDDDIDDEMVSSVVD